MGRRGRPKHPDVLTPREWEVLGLLREGLTNEQVAQRLGVSFATARYHVSEILSKLGVSSREEAARWQSEPERRVWWRAAWPITIAKAAGVMLAAALLVGIGVLAWSVVANDDQIHPAFGCPKFDTGDLEDGIYMIDFESCAVNRVTDGLSAAVKDWSPDGERLVFTRLDQASVDANSDLYVVNADGSGLMQLTNTPGEREDTARWSPDGARIAYVSLSLSEVSFESRPGLNEEDWTFDLRLIDTETLAVTTLVSDFPGVDALHWSPDGTEVAMVTEQRVVSVNASGGVARTLATNAWWGSRALWSPDGSMIAYTCTIPEQIDREFTCLVPRDGGASSQVTGPGPPPGRRLMSGRFPVWTEDGLLLISAGSDLYLVDPISTQPVGRLGEFYGDPPKWYQRGLVFGTRCPPPTETSDGRFISSIPCNREMFLRDLGSERVVSIMDVGCGLPTAWSDDRLRMSFSLGSYGFACL